MKCHDKFGTVNVVSSISSILDMENLAWGGYFMIELNCFLIVLQLYISKRATISRGLS